MSEEEYRALAARAAAWLAVPSARGEAPPAVPGIVASADGARGLVVDAGRRDVGLCPVRGGRVLDDALVIASCAELEGAVSRLSWPEAGGPDDWPWLTAWLRSPRSRASYLVVGDVAAPAELVAAIRDALPARFASPAPGDNVETTQGEA
jgi:hypothetical protein